MPRLDEKWAVLLAVASGTFVVVLNTTIMNVALPRIMVVFGAGISEAQLVLTGFMLATAIIMPATQYLSERLGSKRLYVLTVALFTLASLLCGLAWSIPSLVTARVLQGLSGGMIQPLGMALLFRATPPAQRGTIMGLYVLPVMLGPILGPTLGGYLVEYVDWRWVFYLNLPVGVGSCLLGWLLLRETSLQRRSSFDGIGFGLASLCSSGALLGLSRAPTAGWNDAGVIGALLIAAITLPLFIWWELRLAEPLLNLRLFALPAFTVGALVNFVAMVSMFGAIFLLPVFLQNLRGLGPMQTGLLMVPQAIASTISIVVGGRLYDLIGPRPLIMIGLALMAAATWPLSRLDLSMSDSTLIWLLVLRGAATGFLVMPAITAWMAVAPASQTAAASALNNVLRQLFSTFATAIFAWLLQTRTAFHQAALSMQILPELPGVARLLAQAQQFAFEHGLTPGQGRTLVVSQLLGQVRQLAAVRAFDDCFLIATLVCLLGVGPVLFLRRPALSPPEPTASVDQPRPATSTQQPLLAGRSPAD